MMLFENSDDTSQRRPLIFFVLASLIVGTAGSIFTEPSIPTWYAGLIKPDFNPPNGLFAPVWTTLYVLMGAAAARAWKTLPDRTVPDRLKSKEIACWTLQLILNFFWSAIFFSLHLLFLALVEMGLLWLAIFATMILFARRDRIAGLLLVPYLAWVSFAFVLNLAIWRLNGG
jgi:benzodiazapine receptor